MIVLKGLKGSQTRFTILTARAAERGATLLTSVPRDESVRVIVLTDLEFAPTFAYIDVKPDTPSAARLTLLRPDWLSESVMKREKLPFAMYSVFVPPSAASSPSISITAPQPRDESSWSDQHFRSILTSRVPTNVADLALDADPQRSRRANDDVMFDSLHPLDQFRQSPRRPDDLDEYVLSPATTHLHPPKSAILLSPTRSGSPNSHSIQSTNSPNRAARRVHFASEADNKRRRALSPDDPLREMLGQADELQPAESTASTASSKRQPFNETIVRELMVIEQNARLNKDVHRANAYRNGIGTVRELGRPIFSLEDLRGAQHFKPGGSLWMKVGEIIATGSLQRANILRETPEFAARASLSRVWGAGAVEVTHWLEAGVESIAQLRDPTWREQHQITLSHAVQVGLQYFDELQRRIPRAEVANMASHIERIVRTVLPNTSVFVCGSFRRGAETCSDVDLLVTRSDSESTVGMMDVILRHLETSGIVRATLTTPTSLSEKFLGVCQLPNGPVCRVDIYCCHSSEFAASLCTTTGSAEFNRAMARRARFLGLSFGIRGIRPVSGSKADEQLGAPLELETEADIFSALGVRFYAPNERSWQSLRELELVGGGKHSATTSPHPPPAQSTSSAKRPASSALGPRRAIFTDDECAPPLD